VHVRVLALSVLAAAVLVLAPAAAPAATGAIVYSDADGSLYLASVSGTNPTTLVEADRSISLVALDVSPDGKQVLAIDDGDAEDLVLAPAAGGTPTDVSGTDGADSGAFSPDGKTIVFTVNEYSDSTLDPGVYTIPTAGGTPKKIVATPGDDEDSSVQFSPDGTKLAFTRDEVDSHGTETITLELVAASGAGTPKPLATDLISDPTDGQRLSFTPDGSTIAYAGSYDNPGIYTVPVAGGAPTQLTTDFDYWPSYSADGSKLTFSRDSGSENAEDTSADDVYELWTMKKDGTSPAIVSEGDFEDVVPSTALAAPAGGSTPSSPSTSTSTSTSSSTTTTTTTTAGGTTTTTPKTTTAPKAKPAATGVKVTVKLDRFLVRWKGKARAWKVTLRVGHRSASAKVKGTIHSHTFVLPGAKGAVSASVKTA
jgi:TolB protein